MIDGIRIFTTDQVWQGIIKNLGGIIVADKNMADVNLDAMKVKQPISMIELKSQILQTAAQNQKKIILKVFGCDVALSDLQMRIVVLLARAGSISSANMKSVLGIAPDATTHAIDTAIYNLRRVFGRDFIKLKNGRYEL